jgi:hypothetical protein
MDDDGLTIITERTETSEIKKININLKRFDELDRQNDIEFLDEENNSDLDLDEILNKYPGQEEIFKKIPKDAFREGFYIEEDVKNINVFVGNISHEMPIIFQGDPHNDKEFASLKGENILRIAMGDYLDRSIYEKEAKIEAEKNEFNKKNKSIEKDVFSNMGQVFLVFYYQFLKNTIAIRGDHETCSIISVYFLEYFKNEFSVESKKYLSYAFKKMLPDSFILNNNRNLIIGSHTTGKDFYKKDEKYEKMMEFIRNGNNEYEIKEDEIIKINNFIKEKTGIDSNGLYKGIAEYFKNLKINDSVDSEEMLKILKKHMGVEDKDFEKMEDLEAFFNEKIKSYSAAMLYINEKFLRNKRNNIFEIEIDNKDDEFIKNFYEENKMPFSLFVRPEKNYSNEKFIVGGSIQSLLYSESVIEENFKGYDKILSFSGHNHEHKNSQKRHAGQGSIVTGRYSFPDYEGEYLGEYKSFIPIKIEYFNNKINKENGIFEISLPAGTRENVYGEGFKKRFGNLNLTNIGIFMMYKNGSLSWVDRNLDLINKE